MAAARGWCGASRLLAILFWPFCSGHLFISWPDLGSLLVRSITRERDKDNDAAGVFESRDQIEETLMFFFKADVVRLLCCPLRTDESVFLHFFVYLGDIEARGRLGEAPLAREVEEELTCRDDVVARKDWVHVLTTNRE